jgi:hypothetical protein
MGEETLIHENLKILHNLFNGMVMVQSGRFEQVHSLVLAQQCFYVGYTARILRELGKADLA